MTTMLLVTIRPTPDTPGCPVFGMFMPRRAGWLRTLSGVSPAGTCHTRSPRSRLRAESTPYGGLEMGRTSTVSPALATASSAGVGAGAPSDDFRLVGANGLPDPS